MQCSWGERLPKNPRMIEKKGEALNLSLGRVGAEKNKGGKRAASGYSKAEWARPQSSLGAATKKRFIKGKNFGGGKKIRISP